MSTGVLNRNYTHSGLITMALDHDWPTVGRLSYAVVCTFFAVVTNSFFVASFFIDDRFNRAGCGFLASVGAADLLISCGVMPVVSVLLLSGEGDNETVCHLLHFLTVSSTYAYSMSFMFASYEEFYRLRRRPRQYTLFTRIRVLAITASIYGLSFIGAWIGVYRGLEFDYCSLKDHGNLTFRITTNLLCHVIPGFLSTIFLLSSIVIIVCRAMGYSYYCRSSEYQNDICIIWLHLGTYILYAACWSPYLASIYEAPNSSKARLYNNVWVAVCRTLITSTLYICLNKNFRQASLQLFNYCFCKIAMSRYPRGRLRCYELEVRPREIRTHVLHQAAPSMSPNRASSSRDTQDL